MTDEIMFNAKLKVDNDKRIVHCAQNYTIVPVSQEQVEEIRKSMMRWENIDDRLEPDSDDEAARGRRAANRRYR